MSKKMLQETKFTIEKLEGNLNINGYNKKQVEGEGCVECSLKTLKNNEIIDIKTLEIEKRCNCKPSVSPFISFKLDLNSTKKITIV